MFFHLRDDATSATAAIAALTAGRSLMRPLLAAPILLMALLSAARAQTPPQLSLPLACTPGKYQREKDRNK